MVFSLFQAKLKGLELDLTHLRETLATLRVEKQTLEFNLYETQANMSQVGHASFMISSEKCFYVP